MDFSRKVKQIIADPLYENIFPTRLDPNNQSTESWGVQGQRGGYVAAGIGGPITGKGAHCLVIDDPIKNAEEADSADTREKIWEWYLSTAYSRLAPGGGVLIIQTWWHDDDLAGRLQTMMKEGSDDEFVDQYEVIKYPAIAEADEYLNHTTDLIEYDAPPSAPHTLLRNKGEALHPDRYDLDKLNRIRAQNKGGRWWSALYQQNPVPADGAYFMKDQFRRSQPPHLHKSYVYMAWDFAISEKKQSDYTVGTVGLQDDDDVLHVVDQVRFKSGNAFFIVESILNLATKWYSPTLILGFEDGQIWRAIEALLKKRMRERKFYPSIVVLKPITDKMARARPLQGRMQQGMVSFNTSGEWFEPLRAEMLRFPAGAHDDQVDSLAWMAQMVIGREAPHKTEVKPMKSWRDKLKVSNSTGSYMAA
jgi:predicted phage terminase large subunit-like protein